MIIYSIIAIILLFGVFHFDIRKNKVGLGVYYFITFVIMTLMTGLRYRVGGDALVYENYYSIYPDLKNFIRFLKFGNPLGYQPLWVLFVSICKTFDPDYYFYQFFHAIFVNSILFWFVRKQSKYPMSVMAVLYFLLFYFYFTFEIQREIMAICCFLLGYNSFMNKRWLPYYFFAILAFLFHISAVILFVLPFFRLIRFNYTFIIFFLLISLPLIFMNSLFLSILGPLLVTEQMSERAAVYSDVNFSLTGIFTFYFIRVVLFLPIIFYSSKRKLEYSWLFSALLIISVLSQSLVGMERLLNYLFIPYIVLFVNFIYEDKIGLKLMSFKKRIIIFVCFLHLFFVLEYKIFIAKDLRKGYYSVFFPYEDVFDKQRSIERETYLINLWK